jgi:hypothetical protein
MRFEPTRLAAYTDDALLAEIRRVAALSGQPSLSTADSRKRARVGLTTIRRRFGGWKQALETAGLGHLYNEIPPARVSRVRARTWTRGQVIGELRRVAAQCGGETVTVDQFRECALIGPDAVRRRFGGWPQALRAAGLAPANHGRRYTDEECFENLLRVWTHYGCPPKYQEMNKAPSAVGGKAYMQRWGTWNRAIHAFSDFVESEGEVPSPVASETVNLTTVSSATPLPTLEDRREPSVGLRYQVLKRDRFRCVLCGRSPAYDPGCELHVDHLIPFSKGGKTTLDNLRAACAACNLGKGNSLERDA